MRETMSLHEIVLPETEPETEWILGRAVRKVSPRRRDAVLQRAIASALSAWAGPRAQVESEWRFRIAPPGQIRRPLVPDVALVWNARLRGLDEDDVEVPPFAPDVAVEIRSPARPRAHLEHKIGVYLAGGATLVIVVDPSARSAHLRDHQRTCVLSGDDVLAHPCLPGFAMPLPHIFAAAAVPRRRFRTGSRGRMKGRA